MPDLLSSPDAQSLFTNSVLGVVVVGLVYFVLIMRAELKDVRASHKAEIEEKDDLIQKLQDARLAEARIGFDVAKSTQSTLEAFLVAIRGRIS